MLTQAAQRQTRRCWMMGAPASPLVRRCACFAYLCPSASILVATHTEIDMEQKHEGWHGQHHIF